MKHRIARIRKGLYNYRAYNIAKDAAGWALKGEDGEAITLARTLRAMRTHIDDLERIRAQRARA